MPAYYQGLFKPRYPEKYKGDKNHIVYRSGWELRCMQDLDASPDVLEWSSEPFAIPYLDRTSSPPRVRRYFVDFWVRRRDKSGKVSTILIEIKPASQARPPERKGKGKRADKKFVAEALTFGKNLCKWKAAQEFCADRGWQFMVLTEEQCGFI